MSTSRAAAAAEPESIVPYVAEADYPEQLRPVLDPYIERMGFLPNALKLYMHRPEIAEPLWLLNSRIMRDPSSTLDQSLKRRLAALCSAINGSAYCVAHHASVLKRAPSAGAEGWGLSDDDLDKLLSGDSEPEGETEKVCFEFVRAASADPSSVSPDLLARLKLQLTPPQIVELACLVGFWKFYNTVHEALHLPIEPEVAGEA